MAEFVVTLSAEDKVRSLVTKQIKTQMDYYESKSDVPYKFDFIGLQCFVAKVEFQDEQTILTVIHDE